jgi:hypothetical protein
MKLEETEIFLLQNIDKFSALVKCESEISQKINDKIKFMSALLIEKLEVDNPWISSKEDEWFRLIPEKWKQEGQDPPFCLDVSVFNLRGLFHFADESVILEFVKQTKFNPQYETYFKKGLGTFKYETTGTTSNTHELYPVSPMNYREILKDDEINFDAIAEYLKDFVQPSVSLIDRVVDKIDFPPNKTRKGS